MTRDNRHLVLLAVSFLFVAAASPIALGEAPRFIRGDANRDDAVDISDPVYTLQCLFAREGELTCEDAADANDDGAINLGDPIFTLMCLFQPGNTFPHPTGTPGSDLTIDDLTCENPQRQIVLTFTPRQCETHPWHQVGGAGDPEALRAWVEDLGATVNWVKIEQPWSRVCMACGCPRGYLLTISIMERDVAEHLVSLGFMPEEPGPLH